MEKNTNQTVTVPKDEAQPDWVFVGFVILGIATLFLVGWLALGLFGDTWPQATGDTKSTMEDMRNYFWSAGVVAAGIVGTWGFALAAVRTHALNRQAKTAEADSKFSEKKHASEAFATAIEQLGHDKYPVQLGAVYALEALAKSSLELHGPIFETLCAYVRKEAPAPKDDDLTDKIAARGDEEIYYNIHEHLKAIAKPDVVVQAILTVAGRRDPARDPQSDTNPFRLDLLDTDLRKADMTEGHFAGAILRNAHLSGANLSAAHLESANLIAAHLEGTALFDAHLEGAHLSRAHFEGAYLVAACLEGANLSGISFDAATFVSGATFNGAKSMPAQPGNDFRATVYGADQALWPDDDDAEAWDRGEPDDGAG